MVSETEPFVQDLFGNLCEIKTESNDLLLVGRIESVDPEDSQRLNIISSQEDEHLPLLAYGTPVKIISFSGKHGFSLLRGNVYISTQSMLALVNVQTAQGYERRKYFRVNVNVPATAVLRNSFPLYGFPPNETAEEDTFQIMLFDISLGGIRIGSDKILKQNDNLLINFVLLDTQMEFNCQVRRDISTKRSVAGQKQYGCEFVSFSNRQLDQLCNLLFKLQRIEIRNKKKNRYN